MPPLHLCWDRKGWGGDGERDPYLETALRWKDDMTHEFMSKELSSRLQH